MSLRLLCLRLRCIPISTEVPSFSSTLHWNRFSQVTLRSLSASTPQYSRSYVGGVPTGQRHCTTMGYGGSWNEVGVQNELNGQLLTNYSSSFKLRKLSHSRSSIHSASTRFPRERDRAKPQTFPHAPSTWTLEVVEGDGHTPSRTDPPVGDPRVDGRGSQGQSNPLVQDSTARGENPSTQAGGRLSLFNRGVRKMRGFMKSKPVCRLKIGGAAYVWLEERFGPRSPK